MTSNQPSRTSSFNSSRASSPTDLSSTARTILESLTSSPSDFSQLDQFISEDVIIQSNDNEAFSSRDAYFTRWQTALERMPNFTMDIKEACVDEKQMKVWVRSEITGLPGGKRKESIDMMTFNEEGVLISAVDYQRVVRTREADD